MILQFDIIKLLKLYHQFCVDRKRRKLDSNDEELIVLKKELQSKMTEEELIQAARMERIAQRAEERAKARVCHFVLHSLTTYPIYQYYSLNYAYFSSFNPISLVFLNFHHNLECLYQSNTNKISFLFSLFRTNLILLFRL